MLNEDKRREYYQTSQIVLRDNPQWRLFKMQLEDGSWFTIKNQIRNPEQLRKILIEKVPINVYCSTSTWLNPLKIEHPSYAIADRIFLDNDVFIDIDHHDVKTFNDTIDWMKKAGYELIMTVDSGEGFHQYYKCPDKIIEPNPIKRYKLIKFISKIHKHIWKKEDLYLLLTYHLYL